MKLDNKIRKNGFDYSLLKRTQNVALYTQRFEGKLIGHEVFLIQTVKNDYTFPNGTVIKAGTERFPSNEDFGKTAWAVTRLDMALERFDKLVKEGRNV